MRDGLVCELMRAVSRLAIVSVVGGMAAACTSDSMRFSENPFSNPFGSAGRVAGDPAMTGSIDDGRERSATLPRGSVQSGPLAPLPSRAASLPAPAAAPQPRMTSNGPAGWTAEGGTPVVVAPGETVGALATRYGVPEAAILASNGMSAGQVTAGRRVVIPVYSSTGVSGPTRAAAHAEPSANHGRVVATAKLPERPAAARPPVRTAEARPEKVEPKPHPRPGRTASAPPAAARVARAEPKPEPKAEAKIDAKIDAKVATKSHPRPGRPATVAAAEKAAPAKVARAEPKPEPKAAAKVVESAPLPTRSSRSRAMDAAKAEPAPAVEAPKVAAAAPAAREPESTGATGGDFRWPARGRVISGFGNGGSNEGINIAVPDGTPVKAAGDGTVAYAGSEVKGYGNLVLIRHDNGYVSAYAHNGDVEVKRGQKVTRGQTIAKSGQTGNVTSPQLHFEIRKGSTPVDPMRYLASAN